MLTRTEAKQLRFHMITIEDLVPEDHFLRKLERHIDFSFIYYDIAGCYSEKTGRPSIDPIILGNTAQRGKCDIIKTWISR